MAVQCSVVSLLGRWLWVVVLAQLQLQDTADTAAGSTRQPSVSHTATFVCEVGANDTAYVDLHWVNGGRRKLKHTFTAAGEQWTTRTVPGHQFAAFLRTTASSVAASSVASADHNAGLEMQTPREQLLARFTVGENSGHVHRVRVPSVDDSATGPTHAPPRGAARTVDLTPAEAAAVAAAAAEIQLARAAPPRPKHIMATGTLPIPQIGPRRYDGDKSRYVRGDESKWRPDAERATLVAKQPHLVRAITAQGFEKLAIPAKLFGKLRLFYDTETGRGSTALEWEKGGPRLIYDPRDSGRVPTTVVTLSTELRDAIVDVLRTEIAIWSGISPSQLVKSAVYGIREYHRGVVLKRHVDRVQSHVLSAILNIAQEGMDSQWCLTIQDHHGEEHEVVLLPGEMLLYESAALVHGRPYPLDGELYANAFVHFRPAAGWDYTPGDIIDDYLPAKVAFVNQVALQSPHTGSSESSHKFGAVGLFWCRGLRHDVLQGVDRRHLHSFTVDTGSRYISRTDPGHTFEAYGFTIGLPTTRWQDGILLGRYVAVEGESVVHVNVPTVEKLLPHPTSTVDNGHSEEGRNAKTEL